MSSRFILNPTNLLVLPEMLVGDFRYANWRGSSQQAGALGLVAEAARSAIGLNSVAFFVPTDSAWEFRDIEALLMRHGIKVWAPGYFRDELYFSVKKRQAHWAQYVLLREGVPLLHGLLDGSRANPPAAVASESATGLDLDLPGWLSGALNWALGKDAASAARTSEATSPEVASTTGFGTSRRLPVIMCDGSIVNKS